MGRSSLHPSISRESLRKWPSEPGVLCMSIDRKGRTVDFLIDCLDCSVQGNFSLSAGDSSIPGSIFETPDDVRQRANDSNFNFRDVWVAATFGFLNATFDISVNLTASNKTNELSVPLLPFIDGNPFTSKKSVRSAFPYGVDSGLLLVDWPTLPVSHIDAGDSRLDQHHHRRQLHAWLSLRGTLTAPSSPSLLHLWDTSAERRPLRCQATPNSSLIFPTPTSRRPTDCKLPTPSTIPPRGRH